MKNIWILMLLAVTVGMTSCVSNKKYAELQDSKQNLQEQYDMLSKKYNAAVGQYNDLVASNTDLQQRHEQLQENYNTLKKSQEELMNMTENELMALNAELQEKIKDLEEAQKQVNDLKTAIQNQNQAVQNILGSIKDALVGYDKGELDVYVKDGQVYVSLSEQLLFQSGSYKIDAKGKEALGKLAEVLKQQQDIEIAVEGHTDNVPYKGGDLLKDNWDLSVKRATTIARILVEDYGVQPKRITASGKGEFSPVASNDTAEGRQKNRRTEIIITPNLDKIMNMVGMSDAGK